MATPQPTTERIEMDDDLLEQEEAETWDDWVEDEDNEDAITCVFCPHVCAGVEPLHAHLDSEHAFSLTQRLAQWHLDMYGTIQLINYLRQKTLDGVAVDAITAELASAGPEAFRQEQFLKPVLMNDPLLYCLEADSDDDSDDDSELKPAATATQKSTAQPAPVTEDVVARLQRENDELKQQLLKYSGLVRNFVVGDESEPAVVPAADNDTYYFDSYSHVGIHREMISDQVRTDGYRNAIINNPELFKGKVVLDVGCGTGILSMFAAQAGAAKVIGVDCSEMGDVARDIVRDNGFGDIITIVKGKVEDIQLPVDKVDVIVSEWMGYCLLYESMLDTVLFARDKWMAPGGHLFPDKCSMHLQGVTDSTKRVGFWDDVYGFNMKAIKSKISIRDAFVEVVDPKDVLTSRALLKSIDIDTVTYDELDFHSDFVLDVEKAGIMFGFVSSFDIGFEHDCAKPEYFTTGVEGKPTHWQQVFFHVEKPFAVEAGQRVEGTWWVRRNAENPRFLDVEIQWKLGHETELSKQSFRIH